MEQQLRSGSRATGAPARLTGATLGLVGGFMLGYAMVRSAGIHHSGFVLISLTSLEGIIFAYLSTPYALGGWRQIDTALKTTPLPDLISGLLGMVAGLVVAVLVGYFVRVFPYGLPVSAALAALLGLAGGSLGMHRREELGALLTGRARGSRRGRVRAALLDTSVIIDGRILDLARTGFLDLPLVVPRCVLRELQLVADSAEETKRGRGRRGLEVLSSLRHDAGADLQLLDEDPDGDLETDAKLVRLARRSNLAILTNDFNLDRVARLEGVTVLNLNQLSTALKPIAVPGEEVTLTVVKEGKTAGQGIGYLDDGTMVVIENGRRHLNQAITATVASVLQTPAGRMIFAQAPGAPHERRPRRPPSGPEA